MAINGNRIMGKITNGSYVMMIAKAVIDNQDTFFNPVFSHNDDKLQWISATPVNIAPAVLPHIDWFVFKVISSGGGKFLFQNYTIHDMNITTTQPELTDTKQTLEITPGNYDSIQADILASIGDSTTSLELNLPTGVTLDRNDLWAGVWYKITGNPGLAAAKVFHGKWGSINGLTNKTIYKDPQFIFVPIQDIQKSVNGECSSLRYFEGLEYVRNWVNDVPDYTMKGCSGDENPPVAKKDMFCLFANPIMSSDGTYPECNGFRGYKYGVKCEGIEYADNCNALKCMYTKNDKLNCNQIGTDGERNLLIIVAVGLAIIIILTILIKVVHHK